MGIIGRKLKEIKNLYKKQEDICAEIRELSKDKPLIVVEDTWSNPKTCTGFNYKGRACLIQDLYIQRGEIWIRPKYLDLKTKKFTVETSKYYRERHFREITSYKDVIKIMKTMDLVSTN